MTDMKSKAKPAASKKPKAAAKKSSVASKAAAKPVKAKTTAPLAAPSPLAEMPKVEPVVLKSKASATSVEEMRKEQLLDQVAEHTGAKRKDVKPIVEAVLEVMGKAIGDGVELNLKPLGKVKIARTKQVANGRVINLRLRQSEMVIKELESIKISPPEAAE